MAPLAVITGASSGIGQATARVLTRSGWRVVLVARGLEALEHTAATIHAQGGTAIVEVVDAGDAHAVSALARRVLERDGVPEAIVNSAGAGEWRYADELPPEAGDRMIAAPYLAAYHLVAAFMAPMRKAGRGVFVHVGSPASLMPWPGATAYCAARWALRGLHEALVMDLAGSPLRSCHVILGEVRTAYFERATGSHERIPGVGRLIPVMEAEEAGQLVAGVVQKPRRELIRPRLLWLFAACHRVAPWLVEALVRWTAPGTRAA